jgi:hypothetical protein
MKTQRIIFGKKSKDRSISADKYFLFGLFDDLEKVIMLLKKNRFCQEISYVN